MTKYPSSTRIRGHQSRIPSPLKAPLYEPVETRSGVSVETIKTGTLEALRLRDREQELTPFQLIVGLLIWFGGITLGWILIWGT